MDYVTFDKLCKANGTSATALALKLGLSKGNTTSWRKGGNPSADILVKMADELNCTVDALLGRGTFDPICSDEDGKALYSAFIQLSDKDKAKVIERAETLAELAAERAAKERAAEQRKKTAQIAAPAAEEQPEPEEEEYEQEASDTCIIPYYDYPASAGTGLFLDETIAEDLTIKATPEAFAADFAIPISGDSMETDFSSGDIVLVRSCPNIPEGQIGIFVLDGDVYIKEYGGDCLISHNSKYNPIMLKDYGLSICLGRVLGKAEIIE